DAATFWQIVVPPGATSPDVAPAIPDLALPSEALGLRHGLVANCPSDFMNSLGESRRYLEPDPGSAPGPGAYWQRPNTAVAARETRTTNDGRLTDRSPSVAISLREKCHANANDFDRSSASHGEHVTGLACR